MSVTCSLFQTEAKLVTMRRELSALFERRMEQKDVRINQLTKDLDGVRHKVRQKQTCEWKLPSSRTSKTTFSPASRSVLL